MPSILNALADVPAGTPVMPVADRLSFVMGCQIHENYVLKSTEGLSIWFILIWLGGDAFNLFGGLLQGVLWTMWWYYGKHYRSTEAQQEVDPNASEATPLLGNQVQVRSMWNRITEKVAAFFDQMTPVQFATLKYSVTLGFVLVTGIIAWFSAKHTEICNDIPDFPEQPHHVQMRWDAQVLGWLSAVLYIVSRIPQILKNRHTKCAGLSLALFVFAVGGNVSYVLVRPILLTLVNCSKRPLKGIPYGERQLDRRQCRYVTILTQGTILLDFIVLAQFITYAPARRELEAKFPHHL
ncbi:hypothetical protein MYAM1_004021 [Malassezia yamatoensis]|uniref:Uncharacterized protein n=1 Tax=Malassezia yamatoensis TaxID=253288 RepID=A0AAJ5YXX2_9BASI|nr:hypothetical protein MYAM1_004021 [Malassezia yamatoensis]